MTSLFFAFVGVFCLTAAAQGADVHVAVAANFTAPMQRIAAAFAQDTGHHAVLSFGSTGMLYAQIRNGAPFDVLLCADDTTPARLAQAGLAVAGSRFTYATGRLALWSAQAGVVDAQGAVLRSDKFARMALADPQLAPYGAAALQVLAQMGLVERLKPKFVQGANVTQTYQFIASGNALLGFVALSQVVVNERLMQGSVWRVPPAMHAPLRQEALLLMHGKDNPAAAALVAYLQGERARNIIRSFGYAL